MGSKFTVIDDKLKGKKGVKKFTPKQVIPKRKLAPFVPSARAYGRRVVMMGRVSLDWEPF